jgi:hypothetical protein
LIPRAYGIREKGWPFEGAGPLSSRVGRRDELRLDLGRRAKGGVVQRGEVLFDRPPSRCRIELFLPLCAWDRALTVSVGFDQACIDRERLAADQASLNARAHQNNSCPWPGLRRPIIIRSHREPRREHGITRARLLQHYRPKAESSRVPKHDGVAPCAWMRYTSVLYNDTLVLMLNA